MPLNTIPSPYCRHASSPRRSRRLIHGSYTAPLISIAVTSLVLLISPQRADAFERPTVLDNDKSEACIEKLREAPAQIEGTIDYNNQSFKRVWIQSRDTSEAFSSCMRDARVAPMANYNPIILADFDDRFAKRYSDWQSFSADRHPDVRYLYTDAYQRKYLLDLKEMRSYEMQRIPPSNSIEAMGTWQGTVTPDAPCRNSYGDPCGSTYKKSRAGYELNK